MQQVILFEGLVKTPPVILDVIYNYGIQAVATKYLSFIDDLSLALSRVKKLQTKVATEITEQIDESFFTNALKQPRVLLGKYPAYEPKQKSSVSLLPDKLVRGIPYMLKQTEPRKFILKIGNLWESTVPSDELSNEIYLAEFIVDELKKYFFPIRERAAQLLSSIRSVEKQLETLKGDATFFVNNTGSLRFNLSNQKWFEGWNPGGRPFTKAELNTFNGHDLIVTFSYDENIVKVIAGEMVPRRGNQFKMNILIPSINATSLTVSKLLEKISEVKETIEHELTHLVQEMLQLIKEGIDMDMAAEQDKYHKYGVPSKKVHGNPDKSATLQQRKASANSTNTAHALLDEEFYTYLSDTKAQFTKAVQQYKRPEQKQEYFREFVGLGNDPYNTNYWFEELKKSHELKWKLAVSKLYKEVQELFAENPKKSKAPEKK
jgi:hypothetical protein